MSVASLLFAVLILSLSVAGAQKSGKVTYYGANGLGACDFIQDTSKPLMIAAFSGSAWNNAAYCGRCVNITNSAGTSIVVRIIDKCPECAENHFDLSEDAFKKLGKLEQGIIQMTYDFVPCPTSGNIKYRVKDGSTKWWVSVVVNNHRIGVKKFEIKGKDTDWTTVKRADYNEFEYSQPPVMDPPLSFRVTSIDGEVITDEDIVKNENFPGIYTSSGQFSKTSSSSLVKCTLLAFFFSLSLLFLL